MKIVWYCMLMGGDMTITATALKENLGHYFEVVKKEDIFVSKNGKIVAQITNPHKDRKKTLESLIGIFPKNINYDKHKTERIMN